MFPFYYLGAKSKRCLQWLSSYGFLRVEHGAVDLFVGVAMLSNQVEGDGENSKHVLIITTTKL